MVTVTGIRFRCVPLLVCLPPALLLLTGCGAPSSAVRDAAAAFERDVAEHDVRGICAALAPGTRSEVESDGRAPCTSAVGENPPPVGGATRTVDVYGRQARVVLDSDTLFLSRFPQGWKVVAAGCVPRPGLPYDCTVEGG
ncbi:hypothetical protein [Streptomyces sp. NPDC019224]|uniref:hypothetical protein n=1 Tax=Streptomyces sp. NPDC019224 TaxID=3154484 RepID=UPI0033FC7E3F